MTNMKAVFVLNREKGWGNAVYDMDARSKQAVTYAEKFIGKESVEVWDGCLPLRALLGLTQSYNTEFAVCLLDGRLHIVKGREANIANGNGGSVSPLPGSRMLIHVHPTHYSYKSHLQTDLLVNSRPPPGRRSEVEAVIDFSYNILVFQDGEVFNKKASDGSYETMDRYSADWPNFLNYRAQGNVDLVLPRH